MKNPVLCYFTGHSNVYSYTFCRITIFIKNRNDSGVPFYFPIFDNIFVSEVSLSLCNLAQCFQLELEMG